MSIQEAIPLEDNPLLSQLFAMDILNHLPRVGQDRIRRTMLSLIGEFFEHALSRTAHGSVSQARMHRGSLHKAKHTFQRPAHLC